MTTTHSHAGWSIHDDAIQLRHHLAESHHDEGVSTFWDVNVERHFRAHSEGQVALRLLEKIARAGARDYLEVDGAYVVADLHLEDVDPEESALLGRLLETARAKADEEEAARQAQADADRGTRVRPGQTPHFVDRQVPVRHLGAPWPPGDPDGH